MKFNHPEVLYALFLLIIPIIIHLFRFRKFRKEEFTNVKFLKRISRQARKSSVLKKWLVLITRILILSCIIIAFAGPYFPGNSSENSNSQNIIYLDNSYSMQAMGKHGLLLERSIQNLIQNLPEGENISLFTNYNLFSNISENDLQEIEYSPNQLDFKTILLKAQQLQNTSKNNRLLMISDFQKGLNYTSEDAENMQVSLLPVSLEKRNNQSIDTAYLAEKNSLENSIKILLSNNGKADESSVSVYNNKNLLGKTGISYSEKNIQEVEFPLNSDSLWQGKIEINDNGLNFDNSLFFSLNHSPPINVVSINNDENDHFLGRIFIAHEFHYRQMKVDRIEFGLLDKAKVVVLNEIEDIPSSLRTILEKKKAQNSVFIIIPPEKIPGATYLDFLNHLGLPSFEKVQDQEKLITGISYNHPLFKGVFEKKNSNFDYPKVEKRYVMTATSPILSYEDKSPFLFKTKNSYVFTAPINTENSNFQQSPLIVPTFYNIGISAVQPPAIFYWIDKPSTINVPMQVAEDEVLHIISNQMNIIPEQQRFSDHVRISTENLDVPAGNYQITYRKKPVMAVSFNVDRAESKMEYHIPENVNFKRIKNIQDFLNPSHFNKEDPAFWKWFVIFALFFLLIETLLLKYMK